MKRCKPWPLLFALAVGSQISPRLRRNAVLLQNVRAKEPDLTAAGLEEALADAAEIPGASQMDTRQLPRSPPAAPEVSPSDEWEKLDYAAGVASDEYRSQFKQVPKSLPRTVSAKTCEAACLTCMQVNDKFPNCECFATCKSGGSGGEKCQHPDVSWSNEVPTSPDELWVGKCQEGRVKCSECVSEDVIADNDDCRGNPICMERLRQKITKPVSDARYCYSEKVRLSDCETFNHQPKENGWICYTTLADCRRQSEPPAAFEEALKYEASPEFGPPNGEVLSPCIWCGTTGQKDLSSPEALQIAVDDVNVASAA